MGQRLVRRFPDFPARATWPASLVDAMDSGKYLVLAHRGDQVILLSTIAGDLIRVQGNGTVQARLAIDLKTGAVVRPTPGTRIDRWEAEVLGKLDEYEQRLQQRLGRPLDLLGWEFGGVRPGIPKENP